MGDAPTHQQQTGLDRPRVAAALRHARQALLARPAASAADLAQAALLPLLYALGIEIFDLGTLRLEESTERSVGYRLSGPKPGTKITLVAPGEPIPRASGEEPLFVASDGRRWLLSAAGEGALDVDLFDPGLATALHALLCSGGSATERLEAARHRLQQARAESPSSLSPLGRIELEEVRRYAQQVKHLRGNLLAWFEGEQLEVTSRSGFYYLLGALALAHGREDAIPGDDLVQPPDQPPPERRSRPLARPGWHLLLDHDQETASRRTAALLDALQLRGTLTASQRGHPFPPGDD